MVFRVLEKGIGSFCYANLREEASTELQVLTKLILIYF